MLGAKISERCAIVKLINSVEKTTVRADSSASRGSSKEYLADAVLLMLASSKVQLGDVVTVAGANVQVIAKFPRYDVNGRLDHLEVHAMRWSR